MTTLVPSIPVAVPSSPAISVRNHFDILAVLIPELRYFLAVSISHLSPYALSFSQRQQHQVGSLGLHFSNLIQEV